MSNNPNQKNYGYPDGVVAVMDHNKYQSGEVKIVPHERPIMTEIKSLKPVFVQLARLHSSRLPNKLLQGLTSPTDTLLERGCQKLNMLNDVPTIILSPREDKPIWDTAKKYQLNIRKIPDTNDWEELSAAVAEAVSDISFIVFTNLFCMPFVSLETIYRLLCKVHQEPTPCTTATLKRNIIWDVTDTVIVSQGLVQNTATNEAYYECCPLAYWFPWSWLNLTEKEQAAEITAINFPLSPIESIEINTQGDLDLARKVAR